MADHKHDWELLHNVWPAAKITQGEDEAKESFEARKAAVEGELGREHESPYKVEYCSCGQKRVTPLKDQELEDFRERMTIRETLTNVSTSKESGA